MLRSKGYHTKAFDSLCSVRLLFRSQPLSRFHLVLLPFVGFCSAGTPSLSTMAVLAAVGPCGLTASTGCHALWT
eukprot:6208597-Pleurochrysis_carterae.AAC.2